MPFKMQQMGDVQQAQVAIDTPSAQTTVQFEYAGGTDVYRKIEAPAQRRNRCDPCSRDTAARAGAARASLRYFLEPDTSEPATVSA